VGGPPRFGVAEGREFGVWSLRRPGRRLSAPVSQWSRTFGEGHGGGGGNIKLLMIGESSSQSIRSLLRHGGVGSADGDATSILMGTWSEPVEGREVSQPVMKGRSTRLANARWIRDGRAFAERGNLVYTPREFSRGKPPTASN